MEGLKLIIDSGATKTEWRLIGQNKRSKTYLTPGITPYQMDTAAIVSLMKSSLPPSIFQKPISQVFYYGTGCKTKAKAAIVRSALKNLFSEAQIHVTHDLMAAAIATCGNKPGIACILGTGSNSCQFNGKKIVKNSPGLGYVLGDEGSGAYLGIRVIRHYLYGIFDKPLMVAFEKEFKTSKEEILQKVYKEPMPSRYLAGYSKFLSDHRGHFMIENIIEDGIRDFFDQHLCSYGQNSNVPIHFVGSIAYFFRDKIDELCLEYGFKRGLIMRQPMIGLSKYHQHH